MKNFKYLLVAMMAAGALTACSSKEQTPAGEPETPAIDQTTEVETDDVVEEDGLIEGEITVEVTGQLADAYEAVRDVYGEDYLPDTAIPADLLESVYGVNPEYVAQFVAEQPMISMHPDLFIGIEATEGNAEAVEAALQAYQEYLINDSMQYPMNLAKVSACQVLRYDNYVFLVMLGAINEDMDASDDEAAAFAQAEVQKAVDALDAVFAK